MKGIIVKWDDEKGYGFIRIDGSKQEIFCHISNFSQRSLVLNLMRRLALRYLLTEKEKMLLNRFVT